nr:MAG TPA: hypothetical protein [Caudoviricetes sp.]
MVIETRMLHIIMKQCSYYLKENLDSILILHYLHLILLHQEQSVLRVRTLHIVIILAMLRVSCI